jgi:hypothetical protein
MCWWALKMRSPKCGGFTLGKRRKIVGNVSAELADSSRFSQQKGV